MVALSDFRADAQMKGDPTKVTTFRWAHAIVVGFDQSLANTGWVVLRTQEYSATMEFAGMITTKPGDKPGFEDTFGRATSAFFEMREVITSAKQHGEVLVVHEMPSVGPPMKRQSRNQEAGPSAAMAVRCAAASVGVKLVMLNAQHVKKVITGSARAEKLDVRESLLAMPTLTLMSGGPRNEHVYDALALAVTAALETEKLL
jgi:Holliday junction resolvasome RuvABC endonuclease subunit